MFPEDNMINGMLSEYTFCFDHSQQFALGLLASLLTAIQQFGNEIIKHLLQIFKKHHCLALAVGETEHSLDSSLSQPSFQPFERPA